MVCVRSAGNMKKFRKTVLVTLCVFLLMMTGCSGNGKQKGEKITVVTTIFPLYDWARNIIKDSEDVELVLLMSNGSDLHNYQPSVNDIIKVTDCDLFIQVGGESDKWAEDLVRERENSGKKNLNLMDQLSDYLRIDERAEGMQEEEEEGEEETEYDEHIWLSLRIAQKACELIRNELSSLDKGNGSRYAQNCAEYCESLRKLDEEYKKTVSLGNRKVILFADRFPFRYMVEDYGLEYYAAFKGCSAESEASFETIKFLAEKVDEKELKYILILENNDGRIARTIMENTARKNQETVVIDSLQSVTGQDAEKGAGYLQIMQNNLEVLRKVLN